MIIPKKYSITKAEGKGVGMKEKQKWKTAQKHELGCWISIIDKLRDEKYLSIKSEFWEKTLNELNFSKRFSSKEELKIIDIGCGPSGILTYLAKKEMANNWYLKGIDPLIDEYLRLSPNIKNLPVNWENTKLEDFNSNKRYNVIFCLNAADHCDNLKQFINALDKLLEDNGACYFSVNCHIRNSTAKLWRKYNKIIDPMHPYQYTVNEYMELLSEKFDIINTNNLSWLTTWISQRSLPGKPKGIKSKLRKFHPITIFKNMIASLPKNMESNPDGIYSHIIFELKKR